MSLTQSHIAERATILAWHGTAPRFGNHVVVLDGARIVGDVSLGDEANIWYNVVARGDINYIRIGATTNIQDNCVLHVGRDEHAPLIIGARVTVGHAARLHGCTIEDETLIGISATVLDGAVVQTHAMVAAGTVVPPRMVVESGTLVAGVPARVIRRLRQEEIDDLAASARRYAGWADEYAAITPGAPPPPAFRSQS